MLSYKSIFPTLTQQILKTLNDYNIFTQYMLAGTWVKVGNILLYKKWEQAICFREQGNKGPNFEGNRGKKQY